MVAAHADPDAEKGHLLQDEDDEGSSSELSGGRTAVASPNNRLASLDIEGLNDIDVEKEAADKQERPQKNGAKLVAWIAINTLATIGIVCSSLCCQQSHPHFVADVMDGLADPSCADRSSPTKPSSPIQPFNAVKSLSHPFTSSSPA